MRRVIRGTAPGRPGCLRCHPSKVFVDSHPFSPEGVMAAELDPFAAASAIPRSIGAYEVTALLQEAAAGALYAVADADRGQILSIGVGVGTAPWHNQHRTSPVHPHVATVRAE